MCLEPQDSFDIVPIPCPTGDLCPRGLSLEGSEIATHLVERQSEDYSGEAEMYEDVPSESGKELSEDWQGQGLAQDGEERSFQSDQEDSNPVETLTLPPTWDAEDEQKQDFHPGEAEKSETEPKEVAELREFELKQAEEREIKRQEEELARLKAEELEIEQRKLEKEQAEQLANKRKAAELLELERKQNEEIERRRQEAEKREQQEAEHRELEKLKEKERLEAEQRELERVAAELKEQERIQTELKERLEAEQREQLETEQRERLAAEQKEQLAKQEKLRIETEQKLQLEAEQREQLEMEQKLQLETEQREQRETELRVRLQEEQRKQLAAEIRERQEADILEVMKFEQEKPAQCAEIPTNSAHFELDYISPKVSTLPQRPSLLPLRDFAVEAERQVIQDPLEAQLLDFYARTPDEVINSGDNSEFDLQAGDSEPPHVYSHREDNAAFRTTYGSSIHQRLYEEAYKRRMLQTRYEQAKYEGDLKECTFQPRSARGQGTRDVHQRLYQRAGEDRVKEQVYLRRKLEQELSGCTFTPALGHVPSKAFSPARLYEDAERKRSSRELPAAEPTAKTAFSRQSNTAIYEKLYSSSTSQAAKLRKQQLEREMQATQGATFSPRVNPHKPEPAALPAHERLYLLNEEMLKRLESKRMAQRTDSAVRREGREEEPRYEALYMDGAKRQKRQAALQAKVDFELGINFMPRTNLHAAHPSA